VYNEDVHSNTSTVQNFLCAVCETLILLRTSTMMQASAQKVAAQQPGPQ
jgi:hypothetical protein